MENVARVPAWAVGLGSALDEKMGLELLRVTPTLTSGRCPVAGNTQIDGHWHGGASCVMAETLGSIAATAHARTLDKRAVGVDINATHHRGVRAGFVFGTATAIHLGRSTASYEVVLTDQDRHRICTARITCLLRDNPPAEGPHPS